MESAPDQDPVSKKMTAADKQALEALEFDWGEAYLIGRDDEGSWWAARRDRIGHLLTAGGADELRASIRTDYDREPVLRDRPGQEST